MCPDNISCHSGDTAPAQDVTQGVMGRHRIKCPMGTYIYRILNWYFWNWNSLS